MVRYSINTVTSITFIAMFEQRFSRGESRTKVDLSASSMGSDMVVYIYNENAHIGAVAIGEYDFKNERASTSVITRLGHKDDVIAQRIAYLLAKHFRIAVCVIVGVHLDNITENEIQQILTNVELLGNDLITEGNKIFHHKVAE